jgi:hypothetical protein
MSDKDYLDVWVCDVETFKDCFTLVAANESKKKMYVFEISSRKDDSQRLRKFLGQLYKNKETLVGFNFVGFDYPVIVHFLENKGITCTELHEFANDIIAAQNSEDDKFKYQVPKNKQWIRCVDLYLINHFNNKARATSLKMIEFNMRSEMIEDLPYNPTDDLTEDQIQKIVEYNKHDVLETLKFYKECLGAVKFRDVLSEQLGMDVTNFDDTKIGKQFFINELEKNDPEACYKNVGGRKIKRQTKRDSIDLSETILPYIKFKRPEFKAVKEWVAKQVITETKGVFTDIEEHELGELAKYAHMETKSKKLKTKETKDRDLYKQVRKRIREEDLDESEVEQLEDSIYGVPDQDEIDELLELHPKGWVERTRLKSGKTSFNFNWRIAPNLNTVVDGFVWDFGVGGVHGATAGKSYVKDESQRIMSWDVTSYYPNLSIRNRIYPEHLGEMFCDVYEELFERRKKYPKGTPQNLSLKLSLNASYGASNDKYSVMFDPKFTMKITLAGQLSLAMLGEWLVEGCETLNIIMVNTDGLEFTVHPDEVEKSTQICQEWEKATKLQLEGEEYDKLFIANVNNYVGVFTDGKVKRKGAYEYEGLGWHQNQSALVIKRAAVLEMTDGIPLEKTIRDCRDPYDFMLRTKVPRSSRLVLRYHDSDGDLMREEQQQNITRYYIANDGGSLIKVMPPLPKDPEKEREIGIDKEWLVKTCNNMKNFDWDINYDYYISEAKKLVNAVGEF